MKLLRIMSLMFPKESGIYEECKHVTWNGWNLKWG